MKGRRNEGTPEKGDVEDQKYVAYGIKEWEKESRSRMRKKKHVKWEEEGRESSKGRPLGEQVQRWQRIIGNMSKGMMVQIPLLSFL